MRIIILSLIVVFAYAIKIPKEFSADFNQTITSNQKKLIYKGKVFYKKGEIVWKYTYPYNKIIWIKDKVYIYEPDLMQVSITKRKKNTLADILKNSKKVKNNLYKAKVDEKEVFFIFDKTLKKIFYKDEVGNKVKINFFNQKNEVNKSVFEVKYPKDVDLIYQN